MHDGESCGFKGVICRVHFRLMEFVLIVIFSFLYVSWLHQVMGKHLADNIPGSKLSMVPGRGHFAYFDDSLFLDVISWLKEF